MPSFEAGRFCSIAEYRKHIDNRLAPDFITPGEDFTFMGKLHDWVEEADAFALPVTCESTPRFIEQLGLVVVEFSVLDEDMNPIEGHEKVFFQACGLIGLTDEFIRQDPKIKEGYIVNYNDGMGDGIDNILASLSLVS